MKNLIIVFAMSTVLFGCAPSDFYTNGPADVFSVSQSVSIKFVSEKNSVFKVYKIGSDMYAIFAGMNNPNANDIKTINNAIVFEKEDSDKLKKVCIEIINRFNEPYTDKTKIVEYHLVKKNTELFGISSTVANAYLANTSTEFYEVNRVIFRLQLLIDSGDKMMASRNISFMFKNYSDTIKLKDVENLLNDLRK